MEQSDRLNGWSSASVLNCLFVSGKVTAWQKKRGRNREMSSCVSVYFCLSQMLLTCEQPVSPVEVEIVFKPFASAADVDVYTVTCRTASERLVRAPVLAAACWRLCSQTNSRVVCAGACGAAGSSGVLPSVQSGAEVSRGPPRIQRHVGSPQR